MRSELRALREHNESLERRLERMESLQAVRRSALSPSATPAPAHGRASGVREPAPAEVPDLTVVKLRPKVAPPPRLDLSVPVEEPDPQTVDDLQESVAAADGPSKSELASDFDSALEDLHGGNVSVGVFRLQRFAEENKRHPKADNALYFAAVGLMGLSKHGAAARELESLISRYPAGDVVQDAMLKLAECRTQLNQLDGARSLYSQVVSTFPGTAAANQAQQKLSTISQ